MVVPNDTNQPPSSFFHVSLMPLNLGREPSFCLTFLSETVVSSYAWFHWLLLCFGLYRYSIRVSSLTSFNRINSAVGYAVSMTVRNHVRHGCVHAVWNTTVAETSFPFHFK